VNESACNIVKKVAGKYGCLWAGGVSPTELYKAGSRSKKDIQEMQRKQCEIFIKHNADFLIAEVSFSTTLSTQGLSKQLPVMEELLELIPSMRSFFKVKTKH
jgi:methionine synthase I (cobalamin-dependent)